MKLNFKRTSILLATVSVFSLTAYATTQAWSFFAPQFHGSSNFTNAKAGDIIFDIQNGSSGFKGYDGSTWKNLDDSVSTKAVDEYTSAQTLSSLNDIVLGDANSAAFTVTLPSASAVNEGKTFYIKKSDSTLNNVTVAPAATETIDGSTVSITLSTEAESITLVSDGVNDWVVVDRTIPSVWTLYTPTYQGFGSVSTQEWYWRRNGENIEVRGRFTTSTVSSSEARVNLPSGLQFSSSMPSLHMQGMYMRGTTVQTHGGVIIAEPSAAYFTFGLDEGFSGTSANAVSKAQGNQASGSSQILHVNMSAPVNGWDR